MKVRRSGRTNRRIDYAALNETHKIQELNKHPHVEMFQSFRCDKPLDDLVCLIDKYDDDDDNDTDKSRLKSNKYYNEDGLFTDVELKQLINDTKLIKPILIRGANPNVKETYNSKVQLDFNIPNYNIDEITAKVGKDRKVPVMDVMTQNNSPRWNMQRWCDYFKTDREERDKIRNVISLEISDSKLGDEIKVPKVVTEMDIVLKLFNSDENFTALLESNNVFPPKVQKYVLMSVAGSYTDFHIDFAGTSVYYSPLKGHKQFMLIPPIHRNLQVYKKWCLSDNQNDTWFPSLLKSLTEKDINRLKSGVSMKRGYSYHDDSIPNAYLNNGFIIDIYPGDLLLLPSSWIHSVYTKDDSIIVGGNYLNLLSLKNHLQTYKIEIETKVDDQFKFPNFVKFIWLIGYYFLITSTEDKFEFDKFDKFELNCISNLAQFLRQQWEYVNSTVESKSDKISVNKIKQSIPENIIGDVDEFLNNLSNWIDKLQDNNNSKNSNNSNKRLKI